MKKVVISGSLLNEKKILYWVKYFEEKGYEVINYPKKTNENYIELYSNFYKSIDEADILFIVNERKNNVDGYMGVSTYAELAHGIINKINENKDTEIYVLNKPNLHEVQSWIDLNMVKIFNEEEM